MGRYLRMRKDGNGRDKMQIWSDTYAVGARVSGAIDNCPGIVVAVSNVVAPLISVERSDGKKKP